MQLLTITVFTSPCAEDGANQLTEKLEMWTPNFLDHTSNREMSREVLELNLLCTRGKDVGVRSRGVARVPLLDV